MCKCYSVAAQFEECREKIIELPNIIRDLCHVLYYGKVTLTSSGSSLKRLITFIRGSLREETSLSLGHPAPHCVSPPPLLLRVFLGRQRWRSSASAPSPWTSSCRRTCTTPACCGTCWCASSTTTTRWRRAACRPARTPTSRLHHLPITVHSQLVTNSCLLYYN